MAGNGELIPPVFYTSAWASPLQQHPLLRLPLLLLHQLQPLQRTAHLTQLIGSSLWRNSLGLNRRWLPCRRLLAQAAATGSRKPEDCDHKWGTLGQQPLAATTAVR